MTEQLAWVSLPHATFGLIAQDGIVTEAPPISRRSVGLPLIRVLRYYEARGADIRLILPHQKGEGDAVEAD